MTRKPILIVSVTSDLTTDQRVHRNCLALMQQGFEVVLVGRLLPSSLPLVERPYKMKRFKLWFTKGPLFYASYNLRLLVYLLFNKAAGFFANDLDTLPANYVASVIKRKFLVYDSHEFYTGVPELEHRSFVKGIWIRLEKWIFPKVKIIITVNNSIAELYEKAYGKKLFVIRNVPLLPSFPDKATDKITLRKKLNLPEDKKIIILQGAGINIERGAEEAVEAMRYLNNVVLIILGGGDVMSALTTIVTKYRIEQKVIFKPRMPYHEMMAFTAASDLGLTFDKDTNLNYRFSLPNKIFDYIHAGIPVLASRLPEVEKIVSGYKIGAFIESHEPEHIALKIRAVFDDEVQFAGWKKNLQLASVELNWETEVKKFPDIMHEFRR